MSRVLLLLSVLAVFCRQGASIKCYMCNSKTNEQCGDPMDTSQLTTIECTPSEAKDFLSKLDKVGEWAHNIGIGDMFPAGAVPLEMACQKMKKVDSSGKELVVRACILADHGICSESNSAKEGFFCEQCKTDGCNGASHLGAVPVLLYLLVPSIVAFVTLRS